MQCGCIGRGDYVSELCCTNVYLWFFDQRLHLFPIAIPLATLFLIIYIFTMCQDKHNGLLWKENKLKKKSFLPPLSFLSGKG